MRIFLAAILLFLLAACGRQFSANYYKKNFATLSKIKQQYQTLYEQKAFSIEFKDKKFEQLSFEIRQDTIRYIYNFWLKQHDLADTLEKYGYDAKRIISLVADMQEVKCTWINKLDFYVDRKRQSLINISIRDIKFDSRFKAEKYYTLAYFTQAQHFNEKGLLVAHAGDKKIMKINYATYYRITDSVAFAITENFR